MMTEASGKTQPQFAVGDRVFSHYVMDWGTIEHAEPWQQTSSHPLSQGTTWYRVRMDKSDQIETLDDGGGNWDMARIVPPRIAARYGYGEDPKAKS